eukprot:TRINITY_DN4127_c0_g1_i1.p1 TRINITY_DN4127_c0_g1~~TRINITY_DN4127_c0_g1_i1.p1  ORF type:complete len:125 (+),score=39.31 TRINITY_DN4127_c0_g1_i1:77-451(+)
MGDAAMELQLLGLRCHDQTINDGRQLRFHQGITGGNKVRQDGTKGRADLFNKLHNLLLCGVTCDKVIKISDNIHTDAAGQVILGGTEGAGHEAGEQDKYSLHCVVCGDVEVPMYSALIPLLALR